VKADGFSPCQLAGISLKYESSTSNVPALAKEIEKTSERTSLAPNN
jgi:hypothetical protein